MPSDTALVVIDVQNDYFPGGKLPLWNAEPTLAAIVNAVGRAKEAGIPVILVQHVTDPALGAERPFIKGTPGMDIHPGLLAVAPDAPVVPKTRADSFRGTELMAQLERLGVRKVLFCGMQTQNCVGLSAISPLATAYESRILSDCCTAETRMVHAFALAGFGDIVKVLPSEEAI